MSATRTFADAEPVPSSGIRGAICRRVGAGARRNYKGIPSCNLKANLGTTLRSGKRSEGRGCGRREGARECGGSHSVLEDAALGAL